MYCVSDSTGAEDLCHQENGEWHCESESAASAEEVVDSNGCVQHGMSQAQFTYIYDYQLLTLLALTFAGTHWHCPEGVSEPCTAQLGDYDMGLHVAALFVLLISSGVGVFLPVIFASKKAARGRFSSSVIYVSFPLKKSPQSFQRYLLLPMVCNYRFVIMFFVTLVQVSSSRQVRLQDAV